MNKELSFSKFIKELKEKKIIVLGEIHGTREIPKIIQKIIVSLAKNKSINLFLEVPTDQQKFIYNKEIPFYKEKESMDGRNSKEYFNLIKYLRKFKSQIKIFCIDPLIWDKNRDYNIYKNIIRIMKESKDASVFICGNIHAYKNTIEINNKKIEPTAYYLKNFLKDKMVSINFIPLSGEFFNTTLKKIPEDKIKHLFFKEKIVRLDKKGGYDYNYYLKKVSPCSFIN